VRDRLKALRTMPAGGRRKRLLATVALAVVALAVVGVVIGVGVEQVFVHRRSVELALLSLLRSARLGRLVLARRR